MAKQPPKIKRPSWDEYFLQISDLVSTRATCSRLHVGAILVRDRMIISTGYNGSPRKTDQCDEVGCRIVNGHCARVVHAEANAVTQAAYHGISTKEATLYTRYLPCEHCTKILINAGIEKIVYREVYENIDQPYTKELLRQAKVKLAKLPKKK
ncbi:MAG: deoxycytidylate deaminase [Patescibacteria group bacterium]